MAWLTIDRQREIDDKIRSIYLATNKLYPDDGLIEILDHYGLDVVDYDFGDDADKIMGAIKYPEQSSKVERPVILVNKSKNPENKTFTLAHEFGHYVLHPQSGVKFRLDYDYSSNTDELISETEANYFAGALLMPKDKLLELVNSTSNLDEVAKYFGVSRKALDVRLAWIRKN